MDTKVRSWSSVNMDQQDNMQEISMENFPFKAYLNLEPIIDYWRKELQSGNHFTSQMAKFIVEEFEKNKDLHGPIDDLSVLNNNPELISAILSVHYPPDPCGNEIISTNIPFSFVSIHSTNKFKEMISQKNDLSQSGLKVDANNAFIGKILNAYSLILKEFYGVEINFDFPFLFAIENGETGLHSYYKTSFNSKFLKPKLVGKLVELKKEDLNKLMRDITNIEKWMSVLPPENFEFHGTVTWTAIDVTEQEVISQLKHDLLEKESIISSDRFGKLQQRIRALYKLPELQLGLAAIPSDWNQIFEYGKKIGNSFILNETCSLNCSSFNNSIYHKAIEMKKPLLVEDLKTCEYQSGVESEILKLGIRNLIIAPLYYEEELIGMLELGSPNLNDLNSMNALKMREILSLFAIAVKRSLEEFENKIQAIIKEECTAIHPSVEWRFRKAAFNLLDKRETESALEMEPIVFDDVYPLYGLTDIRNSSISRNDAIQSDLLEHLKMNREIIAAASKLKQLPILDELVYRIDKKTRRIKEGLGSGDEVSILDFVKFEVEPVFDQIKGFDFELSEMIDKYHSSLDTDLQVLYRKRKDFEESVAMINETLTNFLEQAEDKSQRMFPHYFEKYKTDGIEHSIYIGQSLVSDKKFDMMYLKNLRLWQLITVCGIANEAERIKPKLPIPLEVTHLILVQNTPLSIRFRMDEKKFDVDGTYNIRYEIMKKRIDKAIIMGSSERLTQPGKIAIVYSQNKERDEYLSYIEYLKMRGYLINDAEDLELESLQGVSGLRAIRVEVNRNLNDVTPKIEKEDIKKVVGQLETQNN